MPRAETAEHMDEMSGRPAVILPGHNIASVGDKISPVVLAAARRWAGTWP